MSRRRVDPAPSNGPPRIVLLAAALAIVATALAAGALAVVLLRPPAAEGCRSTAWTVIPASDRLPTGWSTVSNRIFVDNLTTTIVGPTPSGATQAPAAFVSVSCYGDDAPLALRRAHEAALAAGSTDVAFASLGDDSFAVHSGSANTTTVFIRQGVLIADVSAPTSIDSVTLEQLARALDGAMSDAIAAGPNASGPEPVPPASAAVAATAAPSATPIPESHVAPDLEALLPGQVAGTALATQSALGTTALSGNAAGQALTASLKQLGKTPADLQIAAAYDPKGGLDLDLFAYRVNGVTSAGLDAAILASQMTEASPAPQRTQVTVAGHATTRLTFGTGSPIYFYEYKGVVIAIQTGDPNLAADVVSLLK